MLVAVVEIGAVRMLVNVRLVPVEVGMRRHCRGAVMGVVQVAVSVVMRMLGLLVLVQVAVLLGQHKPDRREKKRPRNRLYRGKALAQREHGQQYAENRRDGEDQLAAHRAQFLGG